MDIESPEQLEDVSIGGNADPYTSEWASKNLNRIKWQKQQAI